MSQQVYSYHKHYGLCLNQDVDLDKINTTISVLESLKME